MALETETYRVRSLWTAYASTFELPAKRNSIRTIEGLRGLAVFLVFLVHYNAAFRFLLEPKTSQWRLANFMASVGYSGVDLFFTISGFLIYSAVLKPNFDWKRFFHQRFTRIYPPFLAVLALYLVLFCLFPERSKIPLTHSLALWYIAANVCLLPGIFPIQPIITVSWSLSYEVFYYLLIGTLAAVINFSSMRPRDRLWCSLIITFLFLTGYFQGTIRWGQLAMFLVGIFLYEMLNSYVIDRLLSRPVEMLSVACFLSALALSAMPIPATYRVLILFAATLPFMVFALKFDGILRRVLCWTPLRYLGNISYSFYLVHSCILWGLRLAHPRVFVAPVWYWFLLPIYVLVSAFVSSLLFIGVERQFILKKVHAS